MTRARIRVENAWHSEGTQSDPCFARGLNRFFHAVAFITARYRSGYPPFAVRQTPIENFSGAMFCTPYTVALPPIFQESEIIFRAPAPGSSFEDEDDDEEGDFPVAYGSLFGFKRGAVGGGGVAQRAFHFLAESDEGGAHDDESHAHPAGPMNILPQDEFLGERSQHKAQSGPWPDQAHVALGEKIHQRGEENGFQGDA